MSESDASATNSAEENAFVEVGLDANSEEDVAHIQALIDEGKIASPPVITMPPGLIEKIVPRMPSLESLGLSAAVDNISRMVTPEVLGLSAAVDNVSRMVTPEVLGLSAAVDNVSRMLTPEVLGLDNIVRGSTLAESLTAQLAAQMPTFKIPDVARLLGYSYSANLSGILSERMSRVVDIFAASVMKQFDFTILKSIPSWLPDLASLQLHLPTNWRDVRVDVDEIEQDVFQILSEGIPLAWVPDKRVIVLLLDAPDAQTRRRVISNNYRGIIGSCVTVAGSLPLRGRPLFLADMVVRAVEALQDGHVESAQALATNVLDTLLRGYSGVALGRSWGSLLNPEYGKKLAEERSWRLQLALRPSFALMRGEHTVHERHNGFHRNATAHAVTSHQYSRINAVLAIMNATSVLTCFARDTGAFD